MKKLVMTKLQVPGHHKLTKVISNVPSDRALMAKTLKVCSCCLSFSKVDDLSLREQQ